MEDVVLGAKALSEFLSSSLENGGTVGDGGEEGSSELGSFLVVPDVVKAVVDLPVDAAECLVEHEFDPILEEAEGDINEEVKPELSSGKSHFWGVGDVVERLEEVHEDRRLLRDYLIEDFRSRVGVQEDSYHTMDLDSKGRGES